MQNWFATFALIAWPIVSLGLFLNLSLQRAILWTVLAAQLVLPSGAFMKIEMIPQFDKNTIPALCIFLGCLARGPTRLKIFRGDLIGALVICYLISPFFSSYLNGDPIVVGETVLPGVGLYDAGSALGSAFIVLLPFFVGRQFLRRTQDIKHIFQAIVAAELIYTLPLLFEIRFSPVLQSWVYGIQFDFFQSLRGGGYRPMVFMGHGLTAAFFMMIAIISGSALWRTNTSLFGVKSGGIVGYLFIILVLCKSLGATVYSATLGPLVRFASPRIQMRTAMTLMLVALSYPVLRTLDLFPTKLIGGLAESFSSEREQSLQFRFDNEDLLLAHALERPAFGWGRYGRNHVYEPTYGKDLAVVDGRWIIALGQFGIFGFIAEFGLYAVSIFRASLAFRFAASQEDRLYLSALALIVSVCMIDSLPNSSFYPWAWLLCGALVGRAESMVRSKSEATVKRLGSARYSAGLPVN